MVKVLSIGVFLVLSAAVFFTYVFFIRYQKREVEPQYIEKLPTFSDLAECFPDIAIHDVTETASQRTKDTRIDLHYDAVFEGRQILRVERRIFILRRSSEQLAGMVEKIASAMNALPNISAKAIHFEQDLAEVAGAVWFQSKDHGPGVMLTFANADGMVSIAFNEGPCTEPQTAFKLAYSAVERALPSTE